MSASAWDKFLLLSWKNWIIQIRHPIQTIFEVLVPVLVCTLVTLIRGYVSVIEFDNSTTFSPIKIDYIQDEILLSQQENLILAYSPENLLLQNLMENVMKNLNFSEIIAQKNSTELENYSVAFSPFASIEFEDSLHVRSIIQKKI